MKKLLVVLIAVAVLGAVYVGTHFFRDWTTPLNKAAAGADRIDVIPAHPYYGPSGFQVTGESQVRELIDLIEIDTQRSGGVCSCRGDIALHFYKGDEKVLAIALAHGTSIKWPGGPWSGDAILTDKAQIAIPQWFKAQGYPALEETRLTKIAQEQRRADEERLFAACFPAKVRSIILAPTINGDIERDEADGRRIARLMGDPQEVALAACRALGVSSYGMFSTASKERRAIAAAATVDGPVFLAALEQLKEDEAGLCGAARLFFTEGMGQGFSPEVQGEWTVRLARAVFVSGLDEDKAYVMRRLFRVDAPGVRELLRQVAAGEVGTEIDLEAADREEPGLRTGALLCLAVHGDRTIKPVVEAALLTATAAQERAALEVSLALLGDASQIKAEHFSLESYNIGLAAVEAIERFNGTAGVDLLLEGGFKHCWSLVRGKAGEAFDRITGQSFGAGSRTYPFDKAARWWRVNGSRWLEERREGMP